MKSRVSLSLLLLSAKTILAVDQTGMTVQKDIDLGLDDDEPSTVVPGNKEEVSSNDILAYSG